ncbi:MAG: hypothetical protein ABIY70_12975 [Capsulimonas sp.]|uniref:hypothetical protein n=1 Tax=Capsulimonas sp. TaxID=2494211 RepID=UPI003266307F
MAQINKIRRNWLNGTGGVILCACTGIWMLLHPYHGNVREISGEYVTAGYERITINNDSTYEYKLYGDLSIEPYKTSHGLVRFINGVVKLLPSSDSVHSSLSLGAYEFYPIQRGKSHYLVQTNLMQSFCALVNDDEDFLLNDTLPSYFLKQGDGYYPIMKKPSDAPVHWRGYWLARVKHGYIEL